MTTARLGGPLAIGAAVALDGVQPVIADAGEESLLMVGDVCHGWHKVVTTHRIYHTTASDPLCQTIVIENGGNPVIPAGHVYPNVFQDGPTFYMTTISNPTGTGQDLYLWSSTDGDTWTAMNGGAPVLVHGAVGAWHHDMSNSAVAIVDGTWHLLQEAKDGLGSNFRIGYSWSTLADGPNFNTHLSAAPVFSGTAGNPCLVYVPERSALLAIAGAIPHSTWLLHAWSAPLSADLRQPASWTLAPGFEVAIAGIHIADPYVTFTDSPNKPWRTMLAFNYDQIDGWRMYAQTSALEFYDAIITPDASVTVNVGGLAQATFVRLGQSGDAGLSRLAAGVVGIGSGAFGAADATVQAGIFDGRHKMADGNPAVPGAFFASHPQVGLYYAGADQVGFAAPLGPAGSFGYYGMTARGFGIVGQTSAIDGGLNMKATGELQFGGQRFALGLPPTLGAGFGTGAVLADDSKHWSFEVTLGASPAASATLGLPTAKRGWRGSFDNLTNPNSPVRLLARTATSVTLGSDGWVAGDVISGSCFPR